MTTGARRLWQLFEPYHAITYFAPECHAAYEQAGLRGFWRGYFAGRAAPMGAVGSGVVTAAFYGFHPAFVARAVPGVWTLVSPQDALRARLAGVQAAVRRIFEDRVSDDSFAEAAELGYHAAASGDPAGRPLFAANLELERPAEPALALWHAVTLLREHRGDGHVAALVTAGVGPCEAHLLRALATDVPVDSIKPFRGWDDGDWEDAAAHLRERGLVDDTGAATGDGRLLYRRIEQDTDRIAQAPLDALTPDEQTRLDEVLSSILSVLHAGDVIPYPNPVGVTRPDAPRGG